MQFTWEQITAVASVIGVAGGLISVGVLVYEVRRNAQAIEGVASSATVAGSKALETVSDVEAAIDLLVEGGEWRGAVR